MPDFWESRPTSWFLLFDEHLSKFAVTEREKFTTLLPLLSDTALSRLDHVLRSPGLAPYARAKEALLLHFERTPQDRARELRDLRSLGDRTAAETLDLIRSLLPDVPDNPLFEVVLLDLLPKSARDAALHHTPNLEAMAAAADRILAGSPDDTVVPTPLVAAIARPAAAAASDGLCVIHAKWGKDAYSCADPPSCRMRAFTRPRPPRPQKKSGQGRSPGNDQAGKQ